VEYSNTVGRILVVCIQRGGSVMFRFVEAAFGDDFAMRSNQEWRRVKRIDARQKCQPGG